MNLIEMSDEMGTLAEEWIAEAGQVSQQNQDERAGGRFLCDKFFDYLKRAYDIGWHDAADDAMKCCNVRAKSGDDWGSLRSNEAAKCALMIEAVLVTKTMELPDVRGER